MAESNTLLVKSYHPFVTAHGGEVLQYKECWTADCFKSAQNTLEGFAKDWVASFGDDYSGYWFESMQLAQAYAKLIEIDRGCCNESYAIEITPEGEVWLLFFSTGKFRTPERDKLLYSR
jgi:hypothetical protein